MRFIVFLLLAVMPLSGCVLGNAINPVYVVQPLIAPPTNDPKVVGASYDGIGAKDAYSGIPGPIYLDRYELPGQNFVAVDSIEGEVTPTPNFDAAMERNDLKSSLVGRSNLICAYTEGQMLGNADISNFTFGTTSAVSGALGSIFTAATPARILSGIAGVSSATQTQVNQVFFKSQLTTAIIQKIDSTRATQLAIINSHNQDTISQYSLNDMLADVLDYHNQCSFYEGIEAIVQSSNNSSASDSSSPSGGGSSGKKSSASTNSSGTVTLSPVEPASP
jgi:hypothetical protein